MRPKHWSRTDRLLGLIVLISLVSGTYVCADSLRNDQKKTALEKRVLAVEVQSLINKIANLKVLNHIDPDNKENWKDLEAKFNETLTDKQKELANVDN